jgi:hypothetical protein
MTDLTEKNLEATLLNLTKTGKPIKIKPTTWFGNPAGMTPEEAQAMMLAMSSKNKVKKLSESTARSTIAIMRSMASHIPISPFHNMASDQMESLLNEVVKYRSKK